MNNPWIHITGQCHEPSVIFFFERGSTNGSYKFDSKGQVVLFILGSIFEWNKSIEMRFLYKKKKKNYGQGNRLISHFFLNCLSV